MAARRTLATAADHLKRLVLASLLAFGCGCGSCVEEKKQEAAPPAEPVMVRRRLKDGGLSEPHIVDHTANDVLTKILEAGANDDVPPP